MKTKNLILGGVLALIGLLMLTMPGACINAVVVLIGLTAIAVGIYNLVVVYKNDKNPQIKKVVLIKSIVSIVIGLVAVISPFALIKTIASIWTIISYILAVYLILFAAAGIYSCLKLKRDDVNPDERKKITRENVICLLIAILLFIIPIEAVGKTFVRVLGIVGLVIGAVLILVEIIVSKRTTVISAEDVDVKDEDSKTEQTEQTDSPKTNADETDASIE